MTECLDEEAILSFCRGSMALARRPPAETHIAECEECRVLVSAVMRSSLVDPSERVANARPATPTDVAMAPTTPLQGSVGSAHGPAAVPVRRGEILAGKYEVERVLGAGGMGVVVAARHTQLDQRFALKFLLPAAYEAPGAVARFVREGKAAAQITSEHVARVVDTGVLDTGAPYLVMEYLDGSDLGELLTQRGRLEPAEAIEYVLQAGEAIVEAHELGIVHRDLKPANLFLTRRKDGSPLVKVLDFGISKADDSSSQLTSTSTLMGSPRYMSPEQMVSAKDVDARTDMWALGVILHELVAGQPVWQADTVQGLCALIATAPAQPLREVVPGVPSGLEAVVLRCLEKAPRERPASVADLALALEPLAPERALTSVERILGVARRKRSEAPPRSTSKRPVAGAATPISSPPLVAPVSTMPDPSASRGRWPLIAGLVAVVGGLVVLGVVLNVAVERRAPNASARASDPSVNEPAASAAPAPTGGAKTILTGITSVAATSAPEPSAAVSTAPAVVKASTPRRSGPSTRASDARPPSADGPNRALTDRK